ncbi:helix-turn-helix transcriptional regulator [Sphingomonas sp. CARO-RG-8B-R24-01]|uniref:helix-turn-helix domain-containing protein n=1 Tax=Sphingomonas sp. CARO-RG-8B-R24-01 TaxID=2914831 RepID=UPI001F5A8376|nr:helix-turn-helix transcriptional regulator [Sphingomonas sp. CARO-RG-8B-R24-01]
MSLVDADDIPPLPNALTVDPFRAVVFPNRVREARQRAGFSRLLPFSSRIPDIPYIRLSKIERGEVVPRAHELGRIADTLGIQAEDLLLDLDAPQFSIDRWAAPFADRRAVDVPEEVFALSLAAAIRLRRQADRTLTIAAIERTYGIAPVTLSRIENAQRPFARWNATTQAAICQMLEVPDEAALRRKLSIQAADGTLHAMVVAMQNPALRGQRMRERMVALRAEIANLRSGTVSAVAPDGQGGRRLPVFGTPLGNGLIARTPTGIMILEIGDAGSRAFGLRACRPTLGGGLPGNAIVIVDPDRYPVAGGLAVVDETATLGQDDAAEETQVTALRIVAVTVDRDGRMFGYSTSPPVEIAFDQRPSDHLGAIVAATFM